MSDESETYTIQATFPAGYLTRAKIITALGHIYGLGESPHTCADLMGAIIYGWEQVKDLKPGQPRSEGQTQMLHVMHALLMVGDMVEAAIESEEEAMSNQMADED